MTCIFKDLYKRDITRSPKNGRFLGDPGRVQSFGLQWLYEVREQSRGPLFGFRALGFGFGSIGLVGF